MIKSSSKHLPRRRNAGVLKRQFRLSLVLVIVAIGFSAQISPALTTEMVKIVYRRTGPKIAPDSTDSKPITLYAADEKYTRIEYPLDPAHGTQMLRITKEPRFLVDQSCRPHGAAHS